MWDDLPRPGPYYGLSPEKQNELSESYERRERAVVEFFTVRTVWLVNVAIFILTGFLWCFWPFDGRWLIIFGIAIVRSSLLPSEIPCSEDGEGRRLLVAYCAVLSVVLFSLIRSYFI